MTARSPVRAETAYLGEREDSKEGMDEEVEKCARKEEQYDDVDENEPREANIDPHQHIFPQESKFITGEEIVPRRKDHRERDEEKYGCRQVTCHPM